MCNTSSSFCLNLAVSSPPSSHPGLCLLGWYGGLGESCGSNNELGIEGHVVIMERGRGQERRVGEEMEGGM